MAGCCVTWAKRMEIAVEGNLAALYDRVAKRPAVQQALKDEGLLKQAA